MAKKPLVPIGLPVASVLCIAAGLVFQNVIRPGLPEDLREELIMYALPFILIFVGIIIAYISFIWVMGSLLNYRINRRVHYIIEVILIGGIVTGIIGMFQPFVFDLYRIGFHALLFSTIGFIFWSHIIPAGEAQDALEEEEEAGPASLSEPYHELAEEA